MRRHAVDALPLRGMAAAVLLALAGGAAQAGLFDDEEARKAIVELRGRVALQDEQNKAALAAQAQALAQLGEQIAALRRSLLELNNQIEGMRGDMARLRGSDEQLVREVAELQKRQKDALQAVDDRLRQLEPVKVALDGRELLVPQDEKRAYDEAIAAIRGGDFEKANALLAQFQRRFPGSDYTDAVRFWQGNAQYGQRDYKGAIATFRAFVTAAPQHPRAPEALLALANSQAELKDRPGARRTIDELVKAYPQSEAATAGKERLASLR